MVILLGPLHKHLVSLLKLLSRPSKVIKILYINIVRTAKYESSSFASYWLFLAFFFFLVVSKGPALHKGEVSQNQLFGLLWATVSVTEQSLTILMALRLV